MRASDDIRLLIVDDHPVVLDGVSMAVRKDPRIRVIGASCTIHGAEVIAQEHAPDVVLLDLRLPDVLASEAVRRLRAASPTARILLFTAFADYQAIHAALSEGADGCLLKDAATTELIPSIYRVLLGRNVIDPRLAHPDGVAGRQDGLLRLSITRREHEVLRHVALGKTNPEIGVELGLTRSTVKTYLQSAMHKLGARNRIDAIIKANEARLL